MDLGHRDHAEELKGVMRLLPYPVTIVTASDGNAFRGITIGSFTSLSLEPALISFNVTRNSQMHELLEKASRFVVHIPGIGQQSLCVRFSLPDLSGREQFSGLDYEIEEGFPPVLGGMIAAIRCQRFRLVEAGDSSLIIGRVEHVQKFRKEPAILYLDGTYHSPGSV